MEAMKNTRRRDHNLSEIIDVRLNHFRRRAERTQIDAMSLSALCFWPRRGAREASPNPRAFSPSENTGDLQGDGMPGLRKKRLKS
jgi:hypothetical protein